MPGACPFLKRFGMADRRAQLRLRFVGQGEESKREGILFTRGAIGAVGTPRRTEYHRTDSPSESAISIGG
jgi:hypothetical protein